MHPLAHCFNMFWLQSFGPAEDKAMPVLSYGSTSQVKLTPGQYVNSFRTGAVLSFMISFILLSTSTLQRPSSPIGLFKIRRHLVKV